MYTASIQQKTSNFFKAWSIVSDHFCQTADVTYSRLLNFCERNPLGMAMEALVKPWYALRAQHEAFIATPAIGQFTQTRQKRCSGVCRTTCMMSREAGQAATRAACIPASAAEITGEEAQHMLHRLRYSEVETELAQRTIRTSHVVSGNGGNDGMGPVLVCLHGFDSNLLEFRYMLPLLDAANVEAHFVDILGWGLTERPVRDDFSYGPAAKRKHLLAYIEKFAKGRDIVLVGTSIGGAVAIDYLLHGGGGDIQGLVLIDAQAFTDKRESWVTRVPGVAGVGAEILRSDWLRGLAIDMAYHATRFKIPDTMRIGGLHCRSPGWKEATVDFVRGAGYCLSERVQDIAVPTLVLWGEHDRVLPKGDAAKFELAIRGCHLETIEDCGHSPHIEKPREVTDAIMRFLASLGEQ